MGYVQNMGMLGDEMFNAKLLNAVCKAAADIGSSGQTGAARILAGKVAREPKKYALAFAPIVASLGALTSESPDQSYSDVVSSLWPLMSIADE